MVRYPIPERFLISDTELLRRNNSNNITSTARGKNHLVKNESKVVCTVSLVDSSSNVFTVSKMSLHPTL